MSSGRLLESDLPAEVKLLLPVIGNLDKMQGCFATNDTLACIASCGDRKLTNVLNDMIGRGLITKSGKLKRRIRVTDAGWALLKISGVKGGEGATAPAPLPNPSNDEAPPPAKEKKERKKVNLTIEEHCALDLPDFIPADTWREFVTYRHTEKGPFSERAAKGIITEITNLRSEGHDPQLLLELAMRRGWLSVFADKDRTKRGNASPAYGGGRMMGPGGRIVH